MNFSPETLKARVDRLMDRLRPDAIDSFLVHDRANTLYFTGFACTNSMAVLTRDRCIFITDSRYLEKARRQIRHMEVRASPQALWKSVRQVVKELGIRRVGFEGGAVSYTLYRDLVKELGPRRLGEAGARAEAVRMIKEPGEIEIIAANQRLNERIFRAALRDTSVGETEASISRRIRGAMIDRAAEEAFSTIIASGPNSSMPHAVPGPRRLRDGDYLLFDMGVRRNHYHSDMTRMAIAGRPTARHREIYRIVLEAQQRGLKRIRAGEMCAMVDATVRAHISRHGYGEYFQHGTGHGVGLEIHERPYLSPSSRDVLQEGMVVTVEPGIYIPGFGGVRIEDLVVVTRRGCKNLTTASKSLRVV